MNLPSLVLNQNNRENQVESRTTLIYRSQVTKDEDWYDLLNWYKENRGTIDTLIALGDNFEKKIHGKYVSLEFE